MNKIRINIPRLTERELETPVRSLVLWAYWKIWGNTEFFANFARRMQLTEIGLSGHVSLLDKSVAEKEGLKPLNRFQKWLFSPIISGLKEIGQDSFRNACMEVMGEDPDDWGLTYEEYCTKYPDK